tara:strand:- start:776 stop:1126 length:351 start_codon:yes stop_codon:yes gene_type:complete
MSLKVTEVGKQFNYGTYFDLSGNTALDLKFKSPTGIEIIISNPRVTAPSVDLTTTIEQSDGAEKQVTFPASTYMQFTTEATDFTESGIWTVCGTYTDATPKIFYGDDTTFTVGAAC